MTTLPKNEGVVVYDNEEYHEAEGGNHLMGFMFGNVYFGDGARATMLVRVNELSDSVKVTIWSRRVAL